MLSLRTWGAGFKGLKITQLTCQRQGAAMDSLEVDAAACGSSLLALFGVYLEVSMGTCQKEFQVEF